ncbi:YceD family protein [Terrisporobacter sp.]
MIISLEKLNRKETDKIDLNFSQKIDSINYCESTYKIASPLNLIGKISRNNKGYYLSANVSFEIIDNCARCLDEVKVPIEYAIEGFLVKADYDEDDFEDYDAFIIDGDEVNLLDIIGQTLIFNLPAQSLCKEDCKGLCQGCGANLNRETCACSQIANNEDDIDPRFAKLKDLFKND